MGKEKIKNMVLNSLNEFYMVNETESIIEATIEQNPRIKVWHGERIEAAQIASDFDKLEELIENLRKCGRTRFHFIADYRHEECYFLASKMELEYDKEYAERISQMVKNTIAKSNTRSMREKTLACKVKTLREKLERAEEELLKYQNAL